MQGGGEHAQEEVFNFVGKEICHFVDRPIFLANLLEDINYPQIDTGKKLIDIRDNEARNARSSSPAKLRALTLIFQDGTETEVDAVIGCDGTWSRVRDIIVGQWAPHYKAKRAPFWFAEGEDDADMDDIRTILADQTFWVGDGGAIGVYTLPRWEKAKVIMAAIMREPPAEGEFRLEKNFIWSHFLRWFEGGIAHRAMEVSKPHEQALMAFANAP